MLLASLMLATTAAQAQTTLPADTIRVGDKVYTYVEQMPQPPGGMSALMQQMAQQIQYPAEALQQRLEGKVFVNFVVNTEGRIEQAKVVKGAHPLLDAEALRVVGQMPAWMPGRQTGRAVNVSFTLPVTFALSRALLPEHLLTPPQKVAGQNVARFPGGPVALRTYLNQPLLPGQPGGVTFVQFTVGTDGRVSKLRSLATTGSLSPTQADAQQKAAEALIGNMPPWEPARYNHAARPTELILGVVFSAEPADTSPNTLLPYADVPPTFDGVAADGSLAAYVAQKLKFPAKAQKAGAQGEGLVFLVLDEMAQIKSANIVKLPHPLLQDEIVRVLNTIRPTSPAFHQNKSVPVYFVLPFSFTAK